MSMLSLELEYANEELDAGRSLVSEDVRAVGRLGADVVNDPEVRRATAGTVQHDTMAAEPTVVDLDRFPREGDDQSFEVRPGRCLRREVAADDEQFKREEIAGDAEDGTEVSPHAQDVLGSIDDLIVGHAAVDETGTVRLCQLTCSRVRPLEHARPKPGEVKVASIQARSGVVSRFPIINSPRQCDAG